MALTPDGVEALTHRRVEAQWDNATFNLLWQGVFFLVGLGDGCGVDALWRYGSNALTLK